jgi:hypothetical protein
MAQKNGLEIFACWIALVEVASTCSPRGDLSKYTVSDISLLTMIPEEKIESSIKYLSEDLDWIEVIPNLDSNVNTIDSNVNPIDSIARDTPRERSILFSSIQSNSVQFSSDSQEGGVGGTAGEQRRSLHTQIIETWFRVFEEIRKVKPAFIRHGKGNYPKAAQALAELNRPIEEYEKAMRNGFADHWHGPKMDLRYLADHFNELLTWVPPKPKQQIGPQHITKQELEDQAREFMRRTAHERQP